MLKMADSDSLLQKRHSCSLAGVTLVQTIFKYFTISDVIRPTEWQEAASRKHQIAAPSIHLPGTTPYSLIIWASWVLPEYEVGHDCWHSFTNIQTTFRFYLSPSDKIFWWLNYLSFINLEPRYISWGQNNSTAYIHTSFGITNFTSIIIRTVLLWVIARQVVVISYRHFGTNYRSHLQGSRIQK